ncbi:MAG: hypothetical protein GW947_04515 [Candidatus Pacebacteria bacterium]|nr:hypothetical protein [Candidatus Paceibacterota bacterium]
MPMQQSPATMPYSRESLEALSRVLAVHQSLLWIDPTTNQLSVKQIADESVSERVTED